MGILQFDEIDDVITADVDTPIGDLPTSAYTLAAAVRHNNPAGNWDALFYLFSGLDGSGTAEAGLSHSGSGNDWTLDVGGGIIFSSSAPAADTDYIVVLRKTAGTTAPVLSIFPAGGSWTHVTGGAAIANQSSALSLGFSTWESGADPFDGWMGWFAAWSGAMSETDVEALSTNWRTSDLYNSAHGTPVCLIEMNTTSLVDLIGNVSSFNVQGSPAVDSGQTFAGWTFDGTGIVVQELYPDADVDAASWDTAPLWSKIEETSADGTVVSDATTADTSGSQVAYNSAGTGFGTVTSGAAWNVPCPATVNAGDILIAHVACRNTSTSPTTPSGWTLLAGPISDGTGRSWVYGRIADGSEDGTNVGFGTQAVAVARSGRIYRFTGNDWSGQTITNVVGGFGSTNGTGSTVSDAGVTTPRTLCLAVNLMHGDDNNTIGAFTGMSGGTWAEAVAEYSHNLGTGFMAQIQTATMASAGTIDGGSVAMSAADPWTVQGFYIRPPVVAVQTSVARISLASGNTPATFNNHAINIRARSTSGSGKKIYAALYEGANNRSGNLSATITATLADYSLSIPSANADDITDYSNLEVRFWGEDPLGGAITFEVDKLYVQVDEGSSGAFTLDAQPASFSWTGSAAGVVSARVLDAQPAAYTLTGLAATVAKAFFLDAQPATYAWTGTQAQLLAARVLNALPGTFNWTGLAATVARGLFLNAEPGSYAWTGAQAQTVAARVLNAAPGSYEVTGFLAGVVASRVLTADPATFVLTGVEAQLLVDGGEVNHYELDAQPATFTLTGFQAQAVAARVLSADPASYVLTGFVAGIIADHVLQADPAAFNWTGMSAETAAQRVLNAAPGTFALTGVNASLIVDRVLSALPADFVFSGKAATLQGTEQEIEARVRMILMSRFGIY